MVIDERRLSNPTFSQPSSVRLKQAGVAALAWGLHGFRLTVAEAGSHAQVVELALVHSLPSAHRIIAADELVARGGSPSPECHLLLVRACMCHHPS